jgi:hypothetical protein
MSYGTAKASKYGATANQPPYGNATAAASGGLPDKTKIVSETKLKAYYTFADSDLPNVGTTGNEYIRLILWGGAASNPDNNTFYNGMRRIRKAYEGDSVFDRPIYSGDVVVANINEQTTGSIQSIDFLCHGGPISLFFVNSKLEDGTPFHTPMTWDYSFNDVYLNAKYDKKPRIATIREAIKKYRPNKVESNLYSSGVTQTGAGVYSMIAGTSARDFNADLGEVDFSKFTNSAKVEIHGCRTAEHIIGLGSFCKEFSALLFAAGRDRAVVIGHTLKSSPDEASDYRRGPRQCCHNGKVLFVYKDAGAVAKATIDKYIDETKSGLWDDYYPEISGGTETKTKR